jgi:hypothetical protein
MFTGKVLIKILKFARRWWLTPVILATKKAEIRRSGFETSLGK